MRPVSISMRGSVLLLGFLLAACGGGGNHRIATDNTGYKVGKPYKVAGKWYTPREDPTYDETGISSWYGPQFNGKRTANGEIFDMNELSAAHPTLPMPSFVRVTNLENGRSVILRVNDRGPFARGRLIDVSRRAAQILGYEKSGTARVRVQAYPMEQSPLPQTQVASAAPVPAPAPAAPPVSTAPLPSVEASDLAPPQVPAGAVPVADTELSDGDTRWFVDKALREASVPLSLFVQAGAFSRQDSAEKLRSSLARIGNAAVSSVEVDGRRLYRVRIGPVATAEAADSVLNQVVALGYPTARVVVECDKNC